MNRQHSDGNTALSSALRRDNRNVAVLLGRAGASMANLPPNDLRTLAQWLGEDARQKEDSLREQQVEMQNMIANFPVWCEHAAREVRRGDAAQDGGPGSRRQGAKRKATALEAQE